MVFGAFKRMYDESKYEELERQARRYLNENPDKSEITIESRSKLYWLCFPIYGKKTGMRARRTKDNKIKYEKIK